METFWFFRLRFLRAYDSAYDYDFWVSQGHKRSYDSHSDSVASESQPLRVKTAISFTKWHPWTSVSSSPAAVYHLFDLKSRDQVPCTLREGTYFSASSTQHSWELITIIILRHEKFLQSDWLRAVVFQLNLKYPHVKITNLLWVVV